MQPLILPLPCQKLTEEEFYALGDLTLRSCMTEVFRRLGRLGRIGVRSETGGATDRHLRATSPLPGQPRRSAAGGV